MNYIIVVFRDVPDVINHKSRTRTFQSRLFDPEIVEDGELAIEELMNAAAKLGFEGKDIIKMVKGESKSPLTPPGDLVKEGCSMRP